MARFVGEVVRVVIAEYSEDCEEGIKREDGAKDGEDKRWEEPGGGEAVAWVEGAVDAQKMVEFGHCAALSKEEI